MANIYYEQDVENTPLSDSTIAVIGYGSQGHAHALNLHDSGYNVIVGLRSNSSSRNNAEKAGLDVAEPSDAVAQADLVSALVPDQVQKEVYEEAIEPNIGDGACLLYAHGFTIHFEQVVPREDLDVIMIAPKGPGHLVREVYEKGEGVPALLAVYQNPTGDAKQIALEYGKGIGSARAGLIETTFAEETETDLFGEQTTLCGGIVHLMKYAFEVLTEEGYQPEIAYFEVMHEMKLIVDLLYQGGFSYMHHSVSDTAEYGSYSAGPKVLDESVKDKMRKILESVRDGSFAEEWIRENKEGRPRYEELKKQFNQHPIEETGKKLRSLMPFIDDKVVDEHTTLSD